MKRKLATELSYFSLYLFPQKVLSGNKYTLRRFNNSAFIRATSYMDHYETEHNYLIKRLLETKSGAFIDVGANVGQTLLKLLSIDSSRTYIGFEPQVSSALNIDRFIKDNMLQKHTILPIGLSDQTGIVQFGVRFADDTAASSNLDFRPPETYKYFSNIPVFDGDSAITQMNMDEISIIKIDVEGAEYAVLKGLQKTISTCEPYVIFECLPEILRSTYERLSDDVIALRNKAYADIYDYFRSLNYSIYRINDEFSITPAEELVADTTEVINYVAVPSSLDLETLLKQVKPSNSTL